MVTRSAGPESIQYVGFNQDQDCFAVGTQEGFRIFNSIPFKGQFVRELNGGIGIVEMLFRCNILALVGGGKSAKWPNNKVMLWDDHQLKCIGELSFGGEVKAVKLRKDKVVVVLQMKIYVYNFADLTLIDCLDTCNNPQGLCALNPDTNVAVLAIPHTEKGHVKVRNFSVDKQGETTWLTHQGSIAAMALNRNGELLATASEKGTLVRVWNTAKGKAVCIFRRGADKAEIRDLQIA